MVTSDEERVFWIMDTLINHIVPEYYSPSMIGVKVDIQTLDDLIRYERHHLQSGSVYGSRIPVLIHNTFTIQLELGVLYMYSAPI